MLSSREKLKEILIEENFPKEDFYPYIEINKFDFVFRVKKDINGMLFMEKIEI